MLFEILYHGNENKSWVNGPDWKLTLNSDTMHNKELLLFNPEIE